MGREGVGRSGALGGSPSQHEGGHPSAIIGTRGQFKDLMRGTQTTLIQAIHRSLGLSAQAAWLHRSSGSMERDGRNAWSSPDSWGCPVHRVDPFMVAIFGQLRPLLWPTSCRLVKAGFCDAAPQDPGAAPSDGQIPFYPQPCAV
jgi:hypothetical protein